MVSQKRWLVALALLAPAAGFGVGVGSAGSAAPRRAAARAGDHGGVTPFTLQLDLGDGAGNVRAELAPLFTSSTLVTFRYPVPFVLEAKPSAGVMRVDKAGYGLLVGDVLRCCSSFELRYDSARREVRYVSGLHGVREPGCEPARGAGLGGWLSGVRWPGGGAIKNPEARGDRRVLFIADGEPAQAVTDALVANTAERTAEIVMVFERPLEP